MIQFNNKEIEIIKEIIPSFDFKNASDDDLELIDEKIPDLLLTKGVEHDEINAYGLLCESILDKINGKL